MKWGITGKSHRMIHALTESSWLLFSQEGNEGRDFPGAPGVKALHSQCGEHKFNACLGNEGPTSRAAQPIDINKTQSLKKKTRQNQRDLFRA